jgi:phage-related protein
VQEGKTPLGTKPLPSIGAGVLEFRTVYVVSLKKAVYVLHAFMKKSTIGIALPKPDAALIEARLKRARMLDMED